MEEVHSGSYGNHSGGRSLAIKIKRHGHYWPTVIKECENFTRKMRKVPEACSYHPSDDRSSIIDLGTISIHAMVDGHSRTLAHVKAKTILVSFDGFFLKMGRSRFLRKHQRPPSRKFRVEKHRLQTWRPIQNRNRQRIPIYFDQVRRLLQKNGRYD